MAFTLANLNTQYSQAPLRDRADLASVVGIAQSPKPAQTTQSVTLSNKTEQASEPILSDIDYEYVAKQHQSFASRMDKTLEYDYETSHQQKAITQYTHNQHAPKRAEIQQMVGIDLYA